MGPQIWICIINSNRHSELGCVLNIVAYSVIPGFFMVISEHDEQELKEYSMQSCDSSDFSPGILLLYG